MRRRDYFTYKITPIICALFLLPLFFAILFVPGFSFAQSEREMQLLRMYFMEDELVVTPTRTPKPISQVAENISIVTAEEIEAMNAHTVAEVLSRVPGIYVAFYGEDFGSDANLSIHGSEPEHVLVLLDGVQWNNLSGGNAITQTIPVEIIKRIEVIKGPASSSWGSSLGGVINIVTKDPVDSTAPSGSVSASFGERRTQDYRADASGTLGKVGYYLYAGMQESGGLRDNRDYNNGSFYAKIDMPFSSDINVRLTAGYSEPHSDYGDLPSQSFPSGGISGRDDIVRVSFTTAAIAVKITENLSLEGSFYTHRFKSVQETDELSTGDQFFDTNIETETIAGSGKIIWQDDVHKAVFGIDASDGNLYQKLDSGPSLQALGSPATSESESGIKKWAVFVNDTVTIGSLSVTPGIRYDKNDVDGDFTSPSLGATYSFGKTAIIRASVARGFTTPPLAFTSGGGLFYDPNPDLEPEKVWSYQGGVETWIAETVRARAVVFHHDMKDAIIKEWYAVGPPTYFDLYFNRGEIKRTGTELNVETLPFHHVSVKAGFSFVRIRLINEELYVDDDIDTSQKNHSYNVALKYEDGKSLIAQLDGRYVWWDSDDIDEKYDTFIWDLNVGKKIYSSGTVESDLFFTAHNLFNGSHYTLGDRKNPRRWVEAGIRLSF